MLPHIRARPVTMERYHRGIGEKGLLPEGRLEGLSRMARARRGAEKGRHRALPARLRRASASLAGEPEHHHAPRVDLARAEPALSRPLRLRSRPRARTSRRCFARPRSAFAICCELGLESWVKTSGSKGFHIVVPLDGKMDFGEVARFGDAVGRRLVTRDPEHLTQEFSKTDRAGASTSTRVATASARRSRPLTPYDPNRAPPFPHRAHGRRSPAAKRGRGPSRSAAWRVESPTSATYGPTCARSRSSLRSSDCRARNLSETSTRRLRWRRFRPRRRARRPGARRTRSRYPSHRSAEGRFRHSPPNHSASRRRRSCRLRPR